MPRKNKAILLIFIIAFFLLKLIDLLLFKNIQTVNDGLFFGLFLNNALAVVLTIALVLVLVIFAVKEKNVFLGIAIIGSTMNLFDRVFFGGVRDYLSFFNLPAFNIADCLVVFGVLLYSLSKILNKTPSRP